jgi:hypothetical protein
MVDPGYSNILIVQQFEVNVILPVKKLYDAFRIGADFKLRNLDEE